MTCQLCPFKGCPQCQHQGGKDPTKMLATSVPSDTLENVNGPSRIVASASGQGLTTATVRSR